MKRFVQGLFVALLFFGSASAKIYTNKTFLTPRSDNMNLAMETVTWHKSTSMIDSKKFGGSFQATGFYTESVNKRDLAKYFGIAGFKDTIQEYVGVRPQWMTGQPEEFFGSDWILYTQGAELGNKQTLADKITFRPHREAYGLRLDYHQKLDKVVKGLFFKIAVPIVHVKTSMGWSSTCCGCPSSCSTPCTPCTTGCGTSCGRSYCVRQGLQDTQDTLNSSSKSFGDYLSGCVKNDYSKSKQCQLRKAKIGNNDSTGVADIDLVLGYNFMYKPTRHVNVNVAVTIPTGDSPDGEYLFQAIVGNNDHWALGAGFDSAFQLWKNKKMSLDFLCAFNYRYLFGSTEKRTMNYRYPTNSVFSNLGYSGKESPYGFWRLGAKRGDTQATPMANFLTRDMKITPGSHFDGIAQFAFNYEGWTFDLGYNLFAKQAEAVRLKGNPCCDPCGTGCSTAGEGWRDGTYGLINPDNNWPTDRAFTLDDAWGAAAINREHLLLDPCTQPSVVAHKIYGNVGYTFKKWEYPVLLGLGGSFNWGTDNDSLDEWSIWAKVGVTF